MTEAATYPKMTDKDKTDEDAMSRVIREYFGIPQDRYLTEAQKCHLTIRWLEEDESI